jgi:hypothetical protein
VGISLCSDVIQEETIKKTNNDIVKCYCITHCEYDDKYKVKTSALFNHFYEQTKEEGFSNISFKNTMIENGFVVYKTGGHDHYKGIRIKELASFNNSIFNVDEVKPVETIKDVEPVETIKDIEPIEEVKEKEEKVKEIKKDKVKKEKVKEVKKEKVKEVKKEKVKEVKKEKIKEDKKEKVKEDKKKDNAKSEVVITLDFDTCKSDAMCPKECDTEDDEILDDNDTVISNNSNNEEYNTYDDVDDDDIEDLYAKINK